MPKYELKSKSYITAPTGEAVPFCDISPEEKEMLFTRMEKRLEEELSLFYTQNPEDYIKLCKREKKT